MTNIRAIKSYKEALIAELLQYKAELSQGLNQIASGKTATELSVDRIVNLTNQHYYQMFMEIIGDSEIGNIGYVGEDFVDASFYVDELELSPLADELGKTVYVGEHFVDYTSERMRTGNRLRAELRDVIKNKLGGEDE